MEIKQNGTNKTQLTSISGAKGKTSKAMLIKLSINYSFLTWPTKSEIAWKGQSFSKVSVKSTKIPASEQITRIIWENYKHHLCLSLSLRTTYENRLWNIKDMGTKIQHHSFTWKPLFLDTWQYVPYSNSTQYAITSHWNEPETAFVVWKCPYQAFFCAKSSHAHSRKIPKKWVLAVCEMSFSLFGNEFLPFWKPISSILTEILTFSPKLWSKIERNPNLG